MLRGDGTGVSTYARALVDAVGQVGARPYLLSASQEDSGWIARWFGAAGRAPHALREFAPVDASGGLLVGRDIFRRAHVHFNMYRRLLSLKTELPFGIMHWTYPVPLVMEGWINLYTVHDAIPLTRPDLSPVGWRRHRAVIEAIATRARRIITVSESARGEIIAATGCEPALVVNCGQPVNVAQQRLQPLPAGLTPKGYFLYCGSIEPRKNLPALLDSYRMSRVTTPLVLAGPDGWKAEPILLQIELTLGAVRLPYQSRANLLRLIEGARALLFPSLAEGFGLPLAESMALGTATLTSDRGALAEVAGGAALLVDPEDRGAMSAGIKRLADDDALIKRLSALGLERAQAFSREAFAARLADVYHTAFADEPFDGYQVAS